MTKSKPKTKVSIVGLTRSNWMLEKRERTNADLEAFITAYVERYKKRKITVSSVIVRIQFPVT